MKVFITGATGFIGGNLTRQLVAHGHQVRALVRPGSNTLTIEDTAAEVVPGDILDPQSVASGMEGCRWVFHCAADYRLWSRDPDAIYRTNVEGTRTVLEAAEKAAVDRVVYTSTVGTIGMPETGLGTETTELPGPQLVGNYKKSKFLAEQIALEKAQGGLPVVVVNPTAPIGAWDVKPTPTGRITLDFLRGRMPAYIDTGLNLVAVKDVAEGHILAAEKGQIGERYLLGGENLSLREIFRRLEQITGRGSPKVCIPRWAALVVAHVDDAVEGRLLAKEPRVPLEGVKMAKKPMYVTSEKAIRELGFPQTSVEAALEEAVAWFRDHGYV